MFDYDKIVEKDRIIVAFANSFFILAVKVLR